MKNSEPIPNQEIYFETLNKEQNNLKRTFAKVEIYNYTKLGCVIESILSVCRQSLENQNSFITNLDYCNLLELASDLIPHSELELLDKIQQLEK